MSNTAQCCCFEANQKTLFLVFSSKVAFNQNTNMLCSLLFFISTSSMPPPTLFLLHTYCVLPRGLSPYSLPSSPPHIHALATTLTTFTYVRAAVKLKSNLSRITDIYTESCSSESDDSSSYDGTSYTSSSAYSGALSTSGSLAMAVRWSPPCVKAIASEGKAYELLASSGSLVHARTTTFAGLVYVYLLRLVYLDNICLHISSKTGLGQNKDA